MKNNLQLLPLALALLAGCVFEADQEPSAPDPLMVARASIDSTLFDRNEDPFQVLLALKGALDPNPYPIGAPGNILPEMVQKWGRYDVEPVSDSFTEISYRQSTSEAHGGKSASRHSGYRKSSRLDSIFDTTLDSAARMAWAIEMSADYSYYGDFYGDRYLSRRVEGGYEILHRKDRPRSPLGTTIWSISFGDRYVPLPVTPASLAVREIRKSYTGTSPSDTTGWAIWSAEAIAPGFITTGATATGEGDVRYESSERAALRTRLAFAPGSVRVSSLEGRGFSGYDSIWMEGDPSSETRRLTLARAQDTLAISWVGRDLLGIKTDRFTLRRGFETGRWSELTVEIAFDSACTAADASGKPVKVRAVAKTRSGTEEIYQGERVLNGVLGEWISFRRDEAL